MSISVVNTANHSIEPALQILESIKTADVEFAEKALLVQVENTVAADKMEIAGQIIDAYA